ncbi:MAG: FAD binding domain-containing protein [Bulleidia sp.]
MILPEFSYLAPSTAAEACEMLKTYGSKARIMAGGTDLINFMQKKVIQPEYLIDIKGIPDMNEITYSEEAGLTIGALAKLRDIELSPIVKKHYPVISESIHLIASTQIRSKGTLAGNIVNASPSADGVPCLFVLNAELEMMSSEGKRTVSINQFYQGFKKMDLRSDEMVTAVHVPPMKKNEVASYMALTVRKAMDLAIAGSAVKLEVDEEGKCQNAEIALGAVAVSCVRAPKAEAVLIGNKVTPELAAQAGAAAMDDCKPISDVRASAEYRHEMVRVFTKRAILKCIKREEALRS